MVGEWEALEQHQQYNVDSISLDSLVDEWESLVRDETQLDAEDLQSFDTSEHEAADQSLLPVASDTAQQARHEGVVETDSSQGAPCTTSNLASVPRGSEAAGRAYMASLTLQSGLHIVTSARVTKAFQDNAEFGVFALFFTATFRSSLQTWTSNVLLSRGQPKLTDSEFNAYCGLEIAMSICPLSAIAEYWSDSRFLGQDAFKETMPRTRFQNIRAALQFHSPEDPIHDKLRDPLWHSRTMLSHFQKRFAEFAVPTGVSSIDEMTVPTKARSKARTYMPSKPDKYGIRFYAVVSWDSLYVHTLWDNSSGNSQTSTPAQRYTHLFPSLRTALYNTCRREDIAVCEKSATALWLAMIGHQAKMLLSPTGYRLTVSDNFYTRHTFAKAILAFTDGEVHTTGTVRLNLIDKWNKPAVEAAILRVSNAERGEWELVAAVDAEPGWKKKEVAHEKSQKKLPKSRQTAFQPALFLANRAGYIVFKDRKVVVFYSNDLHAAPTTRTLPGYSDEAVACCHGLYPVERWTDNCVLHRKIFMAPTVIAVYNRFMNGVDRVDQLRSTNPNRRREKRLDMTLFTWLLDIAAINAYALLKKTTDSIITLREFKRRVADSMTRNQKALRRQQSRREQKRQRETLDDVVGADTSLHIITPNSTANSNGKLTCFLCSLRGLSKKSRYGCTRCERGFHIECFSAFHYQDVFRARSPALREALDAVCRATTDDPVANTRKRVNKSITSVEELTLPTL